MRLLLLLACISPSARAPPPPPHVDAAALPWISDPLRDFRELGGIRPEHVFFDPLPPICARFVLQRGVLYDCSPPTSKYERGFCPGCNARDRLGQLRALRVVAAYASSRARRRGGGAAGGGLGGEAIVWNQCFEDYAVFERGDETAPGGETPPRVALSMTTHPDAWDIGVPKFDFLVNNSFPGRPSWPRKRDAIAAGRWARAPFEARDETLFFRGSLSGRAWPRDIVGAKFGGDPENWSGRVDPLECARESNVRAELFWRYHVDGVRSTPGGVAVDTQMLDSPIWVSEDELAHGGANECLGVGPLSSPGAPFRGAEPVALADMCRHKYLVSASGRGNQGTRFKELLACGSLVFMHASPHRESWYERVEPWTHVVPWGNVDDLYAAVDWAAAHPRAAARIAARGCALAEGLTVQRTLEWWAHFLEEYAALQRFGDEVTLENCFDAARAEAELCENLRLTHPDAWDIGVPLCGSNDTSHLIDAGSDTSHLKAAAAAAEAAVAPQGGPGCVPRGIGERPSRTRLVRVRNPRLRRGSSQRARERCRSRLRTSQDDRKALF